MQLWIVAIIFSICVYGTVFYIMLCRKVGRPLLIALSTIFTLNILLPSECTRQAATPSSEASEMPTKSATTTFVYVSLSVYRMIILLMINIAIWLRLFRLSLPIGNI